MGKKADKSEYKTIIIQKADKNDDSLFVGVNGKRYQIMKGVEVSVPPEVYEVIKNSNIAATERDNYIMNTAT